MVGSSVGRKLSLKIVEILEEDGMKIFIIYKMRKAGTWFYSLSESPLEMASKVRVSWRGSWSFNNRKKVIKMTLLEAKRNLGAQLKNFQTGGVRQTTQLRYWTNDVCSLNITDFCVEHVCMNDIMSIWILTSLLGNVERTLYSSGRYLRETQSKKQTKLFSIVTLLPH